MLRDVAELVESGGEPDDVLRAAVSALAAESGIAWAGVAFLEDGSLELGPSAGRVEGARRQNVAVEYERRKVGELWIEGDAEPAFLRRVAELIAAHVLLGWDTGGQAWEP